MKVVVVGCLHGSLTQLYDSIPADTELVLCCGDFQALRNEYDLSTLSCPAKHRQIGSFVGYYDGRRTAPCLTIVVGGNHEASSYFLELAHGGWLAPNIYYLGVAGSVRVNGLRISGMSGIYSEADYLRPRYERAPLDASSMRSVYHYRQYDAARLALLENVDIFLSHDWPTNAAMSGDTRALLKHFPRFRKDTMSGTLGAPCLSWLTATARPRYWFAGHMHARYPGIFWHNNPDNTATPPRETADPEPAAWLEKYGLEPGGGVAAEDRHGDLYSCFLALSKPGGPGAWWEVIDIPAPESNPNPRLQFDPQWLAIVRATDKYSPLSGPTPRLPDEDELRPLIAKALTELTPTHIPPFVKTAPTDVEEGTPAKHFANPHTAAFCRIVGIEDRTNPAPAPAAEPARTQGNGHAHKHAKHASRNARAGGHVYAFPPP